MLYFVQFYFFDSGADDVIRRELEESCRRNLNYYHSEVYNKSENYRDIGRYYGESIISIPISTKEKLKKSSDKFHLSLNQLYLSYNHDMILIIKSYTKGIQIEMDFFLFIYFIIYLKQIFFVCQFFLFFDVHYPSEYFNFPNSQLLTRLFFFIFCSFF